MKGCLGRIILVDVTAYAYRCFAGQTLLAGFFASNIPEETVFVLKDGVGDNLLVLGVLFRFIVGTD